MEHYTYDKKNGLWYRLEGDYYVPCVTVPEVNFSGIWGELRRNFLQKRMNSTYTVMLMTGKLQDHLLKVNSVAEEMIDSLVKCMVVNEGITEKLKAEDQMAWVQRMNNVRARAAEIVREELIYV